MLCCYPAVAAAAVLLLAAAVRYRVPDGKNCCWFIESDPSAFFLSIQTRFIFDVPLGSTVSYLRPRFAYILGSHGACVEPRRASARRGEAPLYTSI